MNKLNQSELERVNGGTNPWVVIAAAVAVYEVANSAWEAGKELVEGIAEGYADARNNGGG